MSLFSPFQINDLTLNNRLFMAPMTRCFAGVGHVPTEQMAAYYARRASAGLIITEGTIISKMATGYPSVPGVYTEEQVAGWSRVVRQVKNAGGRLFMQLWHVGRVSHPYYLNGQRPLAPSAVKLEGRVPRTKDLQYETPKEMSPEEIVETLEDFKKAAEGAKEAGFDGVEIHGANGYLIDQFMHRHTNRRADQYGTTRSLFAKEVINKVLEVFPAHRVGIRLSPGAYMNQVHTPGDEDVYKDLLQYCDEKNYSTLMLVFLITRPIFPIWENMLISL